VRAPWLLFLRPGFVPDVTWVDAVIRFIDGGDARGGVFRPGLSPDIGYSMRAAMLALLRARFSRRPAPDQGLLISKRRYAELGGHRDVRGAESDLLARIGRRQIAQLDCGLRR